MSLKKPIDIGLEVFKGDSFNKFHVGLENTTPLQGLGYQCHVTVSSPDGRNFSLENQAMPNIDYS